MVIITQFVTSHYAVILLALGWLFSAAMSTMPPLPEKAGFMVTWAYKFLQAVAANFSKHDNPSGIAGKVNGGPNTSSAS